MMQCYLTYKWWKFIQPPHLLLINDGGHPSDHHNFLQPLAITTHQKEELQKDESREAFNHERLNREKRSTLNAILKTEMPRLYGNPDCKSNTGRRQVEQRPNTGRIQVEYRPSVDHVWIIFGSFLDYLWITFGSCLDHNPIWIILE